MKTNRLLLVLAWVMIGLSFMFKEPVHGYLLGIGCGLSISSIIITIQETKKNETERADSVV